MLFNSYLFILVFLPITLCGYFFLGRFVGDRLAKVWLLMASLFFYGWWNPVYLYLLLVSMCANFLFSTLLIAKPSPIRGKIIFLGGLLFNLSLLGYFKYANFFVDALNVTVGTNWTLEKIILPLAISFFTLQQIAYLVDVYEGLVEEKNLLDYGLFVTFFPQLIAGPIVHHKEMMPQFSRRTNTCFSADNFSVGFFVFCLGLFKKVVIADSFSIWANAGYGMADSLGLLAAWITSLSYTFQMYFDFSGYADMAIGLGLMFNIKIPKNFNSPYRATSIINYWDRWHITLSRFINTYVYTPILRSLPGRVTFAKAMVATLLAMLVSGLWHGAAWTFILWGLFHGIGLVINHSWRRSKIHLPEWAAWGLTFLFVNFSLVLFRSENFDQLRIILSAMLGMGKYAGNPFDVHMLSFIDFSWGIFQYLNGLPLVFWALVCLLAALLLCLYGKNASDIQNDFRPSAYYFVTQVFLFFIPLLMLDRVQAFIYFNF